MNCIAHCAFYIWYIRYYALLVVFLSCVPFLVCLCIVDSVLWIVLCIASSVSGYGGLGSVGLY